MEKQELFNSIADAIERGDYRNIAMVEYNGINEVRVILDKRTSLYVDEKGEVFVQVRVTQDEFPYTFEGLKKIIEADFNRNKEERLAKWKNQMAVLQAKIDDAENGGCKNHRVTNKEAKKESGSILKRIFDKNNW